MQASVSNISGGGGGAQMGNKVLFCLNIIGKTSRCFLKSNRTMINSINIEKKSKNCFHEQLGYD